jgi:hypothetical protein
MGDPGNELTSWKLPSGSAEAAIQHGPHRHPSGRRKSNSSLSSGQNRRGGRRRSGRGRSGGGLRRPVRSGARGRVPDADRLNLAGVDGGLLLGLAGVGQVGEEVWRVGGVPAGEPRPVRAGSSRRGAVPPRWPSPEGSGPRPTQAPPASPRAPADPSAGPRPRPARPRDAATGTPPRSPPAAGARTARPRPAGSPAPPGRPSCYGQFMSGRL